MTLAEKGALEEVEDEVHKNSKRWGAHDKTKLPSEWLKILMTELGQAAACDGRPSFRWGLKKVAAVAISAMAWCDS